MGRAEAAPQILGLVASDGLPTPMRCRDGACTALLASFCLQQARDAPADGQDYMPGPAGGLTLIAARPDGSAYREVGNAGGRIGTFIQGVCNRQRLHSALDCRLPAEYEQILPRLKVAISPPSISIAQNCP
jgi:hypothetical protein